MTATFSVAATAACTGDTDIIQAPAPDVGFVDLGLPDATTVDASDLPDADAGFADLDAGRPDADAGHADADAGFEPECLTAGTALRFDGNDDMVEVFSRSDLPINLDGDFTVEAWVRLPERQGPATTMWASTIVNKSIDRFNRTVNYFLGIWNQDNRPLLLVGNDTLDDSQWVTAATPIGTNRWHHVAGVRSNDALEIYVDGRLEASVSRTVDQEVNGAPLRFGRADADPSLAAQGEIDEVRIWNVARSAQAIADHRLRELDPATPGLVAYWKLNEGQGQEVSDSSPSGLIGQLGASAGTDVADPTWVASGICDE